MTTDEETLRKEIRAICWSVMKETLAWEIVIAAVAVIIYEAVRI